MSINRESFDALMALKKEFVDSSTISLNANWTKDLQSLTTKDKFQMDYRKHKVEIRKYSFNHRTRVNIVLLRYCSMKRHTNPDGTVFPGAHVHLFCEGYDDKIAFDAEKVLGINPDTSSREDVLEAILKYCNIEKPNIQVALEM